MGKERDLLQVLEIIGKIPLARHRVGAYITGIKMANIYRGFDMLPKPTVAPSSYYLTSLSILTTKIYSALKQVPQLIQPSLPKIGATDD